MKISVNREVLLEGLQKVQSIVSPRTTLPILSNVLLKADKKSLMLTATDLEVTVRTALAGEVKKAGGTTLPAKRLHSIIREISADLVDIEVDDKNVASVKAGTSFFKLLGIGESDFPSLPEFEGGQSYTIEQPVFRDMLRRTHYAASTDESRYILNGSLLSFKEDKLTVVATDGRRLALLEQEVEIPKGADQDYVVPTKTVNELIRVLSDEGELEIKTTDNQIAFVFDEILIVSKLIEGQYPNFRQVIPSHSEERVTIERETLLQAVRRTAVITSEQSNSIKLCFSKNNLELISETPEVGEAREKVAVKYGGKDVSIAFNPEYMLAPLKALDSDEIAFEFTDDLSPGVIKSDIPFLYVLMPMRMA